MLDDVPYFGETLRRWRVGPSTFLALPERGARLMNWHLTLGDSSVRDILHWPEGATLEDFPKVRGGNPILFPFAGRSFDRTEPASWRGADGVRRPMPIHGLARQGVFKVTRLDARGFSAQLVPDEAARAAYPFNYTFTVAYRFAALGLVCEFKLENFGKEPLPWCAGHHFYFNVPWSPGVARSDCLIRLPARRRLRQDPVGQLVAGPPLQPEENLANPALVDTFHTGLRGNTAIFGERGGPGDIAVRIGTDPEPPPDTTFVTWTEKPGSPFYCVEPWMGPPNAPETKVGLQWVAPGKVGTFVVEVAVQ